MKRSKTSLILNNRRPGMICPVIFFLFMFFFRIPADALEQQAGSTNQDHTAVIVYLHPVATDVEIRVNELPVFKNGIVFGVWCYQVNLTSFLDAAPGIVEIKTRLRDRTSSYCDIEVRKISGKMAGTEILAGKTVRVADMEALNKKTTEFFTTVTVEISLPGGSTRPIWKGPGSGDLEPVMRETPGELVKEVYSAMQKGDFKSIMTLIDPALTNQARMEGIPTELFKQSMREKLKRYCIPGIPVAGTMQDFYHKRYSDRMAPLDYDTIQYSFIKDSGGKDQKGNIFLPDEPVLFSTKNNNYFAARIFLSYGSEKRDRVYISRFVFDRTE